MGPFDSVADDLLTRRNTMAVGTATLSMRVSDMVPVKAAFEHADEMARLLAILGDGGDVNYEAARGAAEEWQDRVSGLYPEDAA